ncbi:SDR family NAD(P)-dependent oxidoreductase [Rubrivivax rivuli]|uniref:SDR family NAD(P)-dependent oxidoreductase n=1 Tax=Rubrivivax rivuli TaxID=1862385 RepID=UPI0013E29FA4|nr:SDR family oxidoreductase [Rubrivivax rivuli]
MSAVHSFAGQVALVTGGTRGLGRAVGIALARAGAHVVLTHRWGSVDEAELAAAFQQAGAAPPEVLEADAGSDADTTELARTLAARHGQVHIFVANACVAARGRGLEGMRQRDLANSLQTSSWPLQATLDALEQACGRLPRVAVAMSSDGPDHYYPGYDYVAASKAALESLVRSLAPRTAASGGRIFGLRTRQVGTQGLADMFGPATSALLTQRLGHFGVDAAHIGQAVAMLATGLLDGLHGQTITIDKGVGFVDNLIAVMPLLQPAGAAPGPGVAA